MCGIVGYVGNKKAIPILIHGLENLEYRGYDSAGVAFIKNNTVQLKKAIGKIQNLKQEVSLEENSYIGIGHTRWATHGKPNVQNSHPHQAGHITLVHNGIIDNDKELKQFLNDLGYHFYSDTDTEVIAALLDYYYQEKHDIKKALVEIQKKLQGSYALGILIDEKQDTLYTLRKDSPLVIGHGKEGNFIASDALAIGEYTNQIFYLKENQIAEITKEQVSIYDTSLCPIHYTWTELDTTKQVVSKEKFEHFMLKEIYEQPRVFKDTMLPYFENGFDSLLEKMPDFSKYHEIHIVACGSAYHAGMVGKYLLEKQADIPVTVTIASEYRYHKTFFSPETLVIVVSQSGETADTLAALKKAKTNGCDTLAIVNVAHSSIAREADQIIVTQAGAEIAVATTKAYFAQVAIFTLITMCIMKEKSLLSKEDCLTLSEEMKKIPNMLETWILTCPYQDIAHSIHKQEDIYFIGRGIDYTLCLEGSLKLKEISYIHSEAYAAGELKHGSISLIDNGTPVIALVTEKQIADKAISNIEEVKSRGAAITLLTIPSLYKENLEYPNIVMIPEVSPFFQALFTIIPLQLIAYEVARLRNCDIDKPKNLAKSVTVE